MNKLCKTLLIILTITLLINNVLQVCSFADTFADGIDDIVNGLKEYESGLNFYIPSSVGDNFNALAFKLYSIVQQTTEEAIGVTITVDQMNKVVEGITIMEGLYNRYINEVSNSEIMGYMQDSIAKKETIQGYVDDEGIIPVPENPYNPDNSTGTASNLILGFLDFTFGILIYPIKLLLLVPALIIQGILSAVISGAEGSAYIGISVDQILFNKLAITDINIFSNQTATGIDLIGNNIIMEIRTFIANWYYAFRNLVIITYLCSLIYIGIRMAVSSIAEDRAKYKNMLKNWFIGLALVIVLHFIIVLIIQINNYLLTLIQPVNSETGQNVNLMSELFKQIFWFDFTTSFGSLILYTILTIITFIFLIVYIKRMITISFLICIAPLITLTYPIDKSIDNRSQILNRWLKEFVSDVLIQFFHCIIYVVLVQSSFNNMLNSGPLDFGAMFVYIVMVCCIFYVEGITKKLFGLDQGGSTFLKTYAMGAIIGKIGSNIKVIKGSKNDNQQQIQNPYYMPSGETVTEAAIKNNMPKSLIKKLEHNENTPYISTQKENVFKKFGKKYVGVLDKVAGVTVPAYKGVKRKVKNKYNLNLKETQKLFRITSKNYIETMNPNMTKQEFINKMNTLVDTKMENINNGSDLAMKARLETLQRFYENDIRISSPEQMLKKDINSFANQYFPNGNKKT